MEELKLLREELLNLKDCITKYLSYIFAGLAGSVFGLLRLSQISGHGIQFGLEGIGMISLVLVLIISFVSIIFFYKFHSHNRLAGYCKVLSNERLPQAENELYQYIFGWESIIGCLRDTELNPLKINEILPRALRDVSPDRETFNRIQEDIKKVYNRVGCEPKKKEAIKILFQSITGKLHTYSWAFPPYITAICLIFCTIFYFITLYIVIYKKSFILGLCLAIVSLLLCEIWNYLLRKLYRLMKGDLTIDAYMLKCLPLRIEYLRKFDLNPSYAGINYINPCQQ